MRISRKAWKRKKPLIKYFYIERNLSASDVTTLIQSDDFKPSLYSVRNHLSRWRMTRPKSSKDTPTDTVTCDFPEQHDQIPFSPQISESQVQDLALYNNPNGMARGTFNKSIVYHPLNSKDTAWNDLALVHTYQHTDQTPNASLAPRQQPQQPAGQTGSTTVQFSENGLQVTDKVTSGAVRKPGATEPGSYMSHAWNWVYKDLNNLLPGFHYQEDGASGQAMKASLTSLGTTILTRAQRHGSLKYPEQLYHWAQGRVEIALKAKPATATIIALYGLAMSEMVTYDSPDDIYRSFNHLDHMLTLLHQRNEELKDLAELKAITWLKIQIITENLLRGRRVINLAPTKITPDLQTHPAAYSEQLTLIMGKLCCLQADIWEKKLTNSEEIVQKARAINKQLLDWEQNLPQYFQYSGFLSQSNALIPDYWECHIINLYRCAQIVVFRVILLDMPNILRHTLQSLASEIITSIPFDVHNTGATQSPIYCMAVLSPLVFAATAGGKPRESVKSLLGVLDKTMNIGHISMLLNVLESKEDIPEALRMPLGAASTGSFKVRISWPFLIRAVLLPARSLFKPGIIYQVRHTFPFINEIKGWENNLSCALYHYEDVLWYRQGKDPRWCIIDSTLVFYARKETCNSSTRQYRWVKQDPATVVIKHTLTSRIEQIIAPIPKGLLLDDIASELQIKFRGQIDQSPSRIRRALKDHKGFTESNEGFWKSTGYGIVYDPQIRPSDRRTDLKMGLRPWTHEEDRELSHGKEQGEDFDTIRLKRLDGRRSYNACYQRYRRLTGNGVEESVRN